MVWARPLRVRESGNGGVNKAVKNSDKSVERNTSQAEKSIERNTSQADKSVERNASGNAITVKSSAGPRPTRAPTSGPPSKPPSKPAPSALAVPLERTRTGLTSAHGKRRVDAALAAQQDAYDARLARVLKRLGDGAVAPKPRRKPGE